MYEPRRAPRCSRAVTLTMFAVTLCVFASVADARIIHRERSLYQTILVAQEGSRLCLQFSVRRDQRNQTCVDQRKPDEMVFDYTRMMMAALLLQPAPKQVLMVGLGGGTLPTALSALYPDVHIDAVEIDPAVVRVAGQFFGFEANDRIRVHVVDARVFTKRALTRDKRYDLILLDAFNGDYIPEHLMTKEYLAETRELLTDDGVLAANTFAISDLYNHESVTYKAVFGDFWNFRIFRSANRVVLASNGQYPDKATLQQRATAMSQALKRYAVPIRSYAKKLDAGVDWDEKARVLTDQYSPANLLQGR